MKRYLILVLIALALSAIALVAGRSWRMPVAGIPQPEEERSVALDLVITKSGLEPSSAVVPKDRYVVLSVRNTRRVPAGISLQGYQDRLSIGIIRPDSVWRGRFLADRPGDDFAWMVEGEPLGRLAVQGSHLVEGHR